MADHRRMTDETLDLSSAEHPDSDGNGKEPTEQERAAAIGGIRMSDIEPYTGLRYLSKLFRFMAIILLLLLVAEIATGFYAQGSASIPTLLGEASRLIVLAGVLWGTGDLAHLLIDVGHDVRAMRVLLARQNTQLKGVSPTRPISVERPVAAVSSAEAGDKAPPPIP
jgi:hypothetical protein